VNIKQIGHAILHLDKFDEDYLIPLPRVKVSGLLTGTPYPELTDTWEIVSSSGFVSVLDFSGKKILGVGGKKNHVHATMYRVDDVNRHAPIYEVEGSWSGEFTIRDVASRRDIETFDTDAQHLTKLRVAPPEEQDPWESRRAWAGVIDALARGDMQATSDAKSTIEQAQREMRKKEETKEQTWQPTFFTRTGHHETFERLVALSTDSQRPEDAAIGFWRFDAERASRARKPFHEGQRPDVA